MADVSGDGTIGAYDASCVLRYDVELIECFPMAAGCIIEWGAPLAGNVETRSTCF